MTYSAVLIDDEVHCTESLRLLLEIATPDVKVAAIFNESGAALEYLKTHPVDLVFLDIEMPEMNGFQLLGALDQLRFDVVFVTAYDQYAIKAFNFSAISYLLKPVDEDDLKDTLTRWQEKKYKVMGQNQLSMMWELMANKEKPKSKIALPTNDGLEFLEISTIIRCESESNYTRLYCSDKSRYLICRTLKDVEKVLQENGFIRIHHSHLINPQFIRKFVRHDGGFIVMEDGEQISISKTKKSRLFELLNDVERL
ncbi:Transcriptional regulatory protein BtsR [Dyadobacter sp. CECT 9275]|uniref:Transcriptional regulatory protein BtsR n=1 Tax=Dyadobacter helix TaxID=2822344 RepID=A0A916JE21_9BACT|nr:LytTR family DNA-binding domain-containing protein [Dyadobacter sp. CECT 9275]CAG5006177.1 Transcriptional regulatory protein BtsR [Dyadobacter sp. CECT 9275]